MAHFAEINKDSIVIRVLVVPDEFESDGQKYLAEDLGMGGTWIQTSYNAKIRGKFAGIGETYDKKLDRFIPVQPYASWKLDKDFNWTAPKSMPIDGKVYEWNESELNWIERADLS
jgi:hypothetical protein